MTAARWTITPYQTTTIFVQFGPCDEPTPRMVVTRIVGAEVASDPPAERWVLKRWKRKDK